MEQVIKDCERASRLWVTNEILPLIIYSFVK